jgi:hypothetical protein
LAPKPAVNTAIVAPNPSPVATTAPPAAASASGCTARMGMRGIVARTVRQRYSLEGTELLRGSPSRAALDEGELTRIDLRR